VESHRGVDRDGASGPDGVMTVYDRIGRGYERWRRPDPRIERRLHHELGAATRVLNVGAGAGSYEPQDRAVVAVEPSMTMIRQRQSGAGVAVRAWADALPFPDATFDAAIAVLTVHHWDDPLLGLAEMRRVTRGPCVVLTFDHEVHGRQWLVADYLPSMAALDRGLPSPPAIAGALGGGTVDVVPVPHDCVDGFCHAWWRRPHAYLDPAVRASISGIARLPRADVDRAMARLGDDLSSGRWHATHAALLDLHEIDAGYRLVVSRPPRATT
jgi:SAM-dependent methyltransferase